MRSGDDYCSTQFQCPCIEAPLHLQFSYNVMTSVGNMLTTVSMFILFTLQDAIDLFLGNHVVELAEGVSVPSPLERKQSWRYRVVRSDWKLNARDCRHVFCCEGTSVSNLWAQLWAFSKACSSCIESWEYSLAIWREAWKFVFVYFVFWRFSKSL